MPTENNEERERQQEVARQNRIAYKAEPKNHAVGIFIAVVIFFILGVAGTVALLRHSLGTGSTLGRVSAFLLGDRTTFNTTAPDVVNQIQRLNRLETVQYSVDTVIEGKRTSAALPDLLFGDRLLLIVHGQVIAGVDMAQLKPENIRVVDRAVTIDLPPSQIFTTRIDSAKSRVFVRTTGILTPADPNLESDTRVQAEDQIQKAAVADGILDNARANARNSIESLLRGLGFEQITVR